MELRWLEDFIALARTQHFSRAAEERNITQPTFSRRIKLLEETMGVTLVDRHTLPLSLTPAGEVFLNSAQRIASIMQDTKQRCHEIRLEEANRLRFATTQSLYICLYKTWLEPFAQQMAIDIELNLQSTAWSGEDFVTALQQGKCDLMLCYWHPVLDFLNVLDTPDYEYLTIGDDTMIPVSAMSEEQKLCFCLPGGKQEPLPYIAYHQHSYFAPLLNTVLPQLADVHLLTMNENIHAVNVKAMIQEGFGLGWVPERLIQRDLANGRLQVAGEKQWHIPLEIRLYRNKQSRNPNVNAFWQLVSEHCA